MHLHVQNTLIILHVHIHVYIHCTLYMYISISLADVLVGRRKVGQASNIYITYLELQTTPSTCN